MRQKAKGLKPGIKNFVSNMIDMALCDFKIKHGHAA